MKEKLIPIISIVALIIVFGGIVVGAIFLTGGFGESIVDSDGEELSEKSEEVSELELNCSSVSSCLDLLIAEGMPEDFLEDTNSVIECSATKCVLKQK